jgi:ATP-dependent Clp protease protease subunit
MFKFVTAAFLAASLNANSATITLSENNSVAFNQPVKEDYVAKKQLEILIKHQALPKTQPIYLVLDTPGGSVMAGNNFIDFVKSLDRPVHTVVIFAASMGYQITQELGKRYIISSGMLMSHRGAISGLSGQVPGEANQRLKMIQDVLDEMNVKAAKRVGMSVEAYQNAIINELWIGGQAAVNQKHADEVASVICDKSLSGTYTEDVATIFGPASVEYSKCPLISMPIGFSLNGKKIAGNSIGARAIKRATRQVKLEF